VIGICYISPPLAAYDIYFAEEVPSKVGELIAELSSAIEIPMYLHILIQFFTPFTLINGTYCKDFPKIVFKLVELTFDIQS